MIKRIVLYISLFLILMGANPSNALLFFSETDDHELNGTPVPLEDFILQSSQKDTQFEEILIDQLDLKYQKKLRLPPGDLVFSIKERLVYFLESNPAEEKGETTAVLSKLFPQIGTQVSASYEVLPSAGSESDGTLSFSLAQPIAENAFGRSTRLFDRIIGLEIDIASHQITEAYEDYLAVVTLAYLEWYEAYENLKIGQSSYRENLKLLDNIKEREQSKIALPIDVNKIKLQVMAKKEKLVELEQVYADRRNLVYRALRHEAKNEFLIPQEPQVLVVLNDDFEEVFQKIRSDARTYRILDLLNQKSAVEIDREADDLLPSIHLLVQYDIEGKDFGIERQEETFFAGVSIEWPLPETMATAEHELARINQKRVTLSTNNVHHFLYTQLKNLYQEIHKERSLIGIAEEKILLAQSVLKDEAENYRFGKTLLNDYIQAVNALDDNRFNHILHKLKEQKLTVEFKRLADRLASTEEVRQSHSSYFF